MEDARLRPEIGFELLRALVLPGDMQMSRLAHDSNRAVGFTQITFGFISRRFPTHGRLSPFDLVRDIALIGRIRPGAYGRTTWISYSAIGTRSEISFQSREHALMPVFCDHGRPVAGKINGSGSSCCRRRATASCTRLRVQGGCCKEAKQYGDNVFPSSQRRG